MDLKVTDTLDERKPPILPPLTQTREDNEAAIREQEQEANSPRRWSLCGLLVGIFLVPCLLGVCAFARGCGTPAQAGTLFEIRLAKCRVVAALYDTGGPHDFRPWCGSLLREHERLAKVAGEPGFAEAYWHSLTYGAANAELRTYVVFPGNCAGPFDVKHYPLVLDPEANIRYHAAEMLTGWRKGYRGRGLCEYVMLPAAPRDWGGGAFVRADARHRKAVAKAYREGRLP